MKKGSWQAVLLFLFYVTFDLTRACREGNKDIGVCLHVYLERDFLSLEKIVYPHQSRRDRQRRSYGDSRGDRKRHPDDVIGEFGMGPFGNRDWIEGPELDDHCRRLKEVLTCFEEVLIVCDNGLDFFRYRHLLYALSKAHTFVCASPHLRKEKFLRFLKTIQCAEEARKEEVSCHRHNVSSVVWNKILRVEVGDEICDSLNTQRACLIENKHIENHCRDPKRVEIYEDLSGYFLSIWCGHPIHPRLQTMAMMNDQMMASGPTPVASLNLSFIIPIFLSFITSLLLADQNIIL